MSIQDLMRELKAVAAGSFPRAAVLGMFVGVVLGPLVLSGLGGSGAGILLPINLLWYSLAISSLLLVGMSLGILMFRPEPLVARAPSSRLKYS